jgi:hypothetical protein
LQGFNGVWGSGATDVWVVGYEGQIFHWDGTVWSPVPSGSPAALNSVWGSGSLNVWVVGDGGEILHWNGAAWSAVASGTVQSLNGTWGSGVDGGLWAVGHGGTVLLRKALEAR